MRLKTRNGRALLTLLWPMILMPHAAGWCAAPAGIIENRGQIDPTVRFYARCDAADLYFTAQAVVIDLPGQRHAVRMRFDSGSPRAVLEPGGDTGTMVHCFIGSDPCRWRSNLPVSREVVYHDLWPGIDLRFLPDGNRLRYSIIASRGTDPRAARIIFDGVGRRVAGADGAVRLEIPSATLTDLPVGSGGLDRVLVWSGADDDGARDPPRDSGICDSSRDAVPRAKDWDGAFGGVTPSDKLNVTTLLWGTFLGGSGYDYGHGVAIDAEGNPVVAGYTQSLNFPVTPGAYDVTQGGSYDLFVAKLNVLGTALLWATFIGGGAEDRPFGLVLDPSGCPILAGYTYSADFPTTSGAFDRTLGGATDGFAAKLSATGSSLLWSTFVGGSTFDRCWGTSLGGDEQLYVFGETISSDFPVTSGAYDPSTNGSFDGFITKLDTADGGLIWSTYLGGAWDDHVSGVATDRENHPFACGTTYSADFPSTAGAFDVTYNGAADGFVVKLDAAGSALQFGSFLGGAGSDAGNAVAVGAGGEPVIAGYASSSGFPTTQGAYDRVYNGSKDMFVARLRANGSGLVWSTFVGGLSDDEPFVLAIDPSGCPIVVGETASTAFPTTIDAYDPSYSGNTDAFLVRLHPSGSSLLWSSYIGGGQIDSGQGLALDGSGNPSVTGPTRSTDFPTTPGAYDESHNGEKDAFLVRLELPSASSVEDAGEIVPDLAVWPNPFVDRVWVRLQPPRAGCVRIVAFDTLGRRVASLEPSPDGAGGTSLRWDGRDTRGCRVPPGVYWLRCEVAGATASRKIIRSR